MSLSVSAWRKRGVAVKIECSCRIVRFCLLGRPFGALDVLVEGLKRSQQKGILKSLMLVSFDHVFLRPPSVQPILTDISLRIDPGSFHFLVGPSGAGKSSLLRLIYKLQRPTGGRVSVFGHDTASLHAADLPPLRRRLGVVFQDFRLVPHLSAIENASLPLRLAGATDAEARAHVTELLHWVGLRDRLEALPSEMSGGEQQRVALARAVVTKPALILADEPTGNVDEEAAARLLKLFVELNKMGTAVLLATHQRGLVDRLGFPAFHLNKGRMMTEADALAGAA